MKKRPEDADLFRVFKDYEHKFGLIGSGLGVNVAGITYDPDSPTTCLRQVFAKWRGRDKNVTWEKISKVCEDFSSELGRVQANIRTYLSSKEARDEYIDEPDFERGVKV